MHKNLSVKYLQATAEMTDVLDKAAALITRMYSSKESPYSEWVVNGFRPFSAEYLLGQVNNPLRTVWVAMMGSNVVGTIIFQRAGKFVVFHKFTRDPNYPGLGAKLLAFMERRAKKEGFLAIRIEVFSAAIKLINYYINKKYDRAIEMKPLAEDEHTQYTSPGAPYGFLTLEKSLFYNKQKSRSVLGL